MNDSEMFSLQVKVVSTLRKEIMNRPLSLMIIIICNLLMFAGALVNVYCMQVKSQ